MTFYNVSVLTHPDKVENILKEFPDCSHIVADTKEGLKNVSLVGIDRNPDHLHATLFQEEDVGNHDYFLAKALRERGLRCVAIRHRNNDHDVPTEFQIHKENVDERKQRLGTSQLVVSMSDIIQVETTYGPPPTQNTKIDPNIDNLLGRFPKDKLLIFYHKGTTYRLSHESLDEYIDKIPCHTLRFVTTPDLLQLHPKNILMQNFVDMAWVF